jgi:hypothetical protein
MTDTGAFFIRSRPVLQRTRIVALAAVIGYMLISVMLSQRTWAAADSQEVRDRGIRNETYISHHERRIAELERLDADIAQRVSKLEAYAESNRQLLIGVTLAVGVMGIEALGRLLGRATRPPH